jgi:hypothetical protein
VITQVYVSQKFHLTNKETNMKKKLASAMMIAATLGGLTVGTTAVTAVASPVKAEAATVSHTAKPFKTPRIGYGCALYRGVNSRGQIQAYYICLR